MQFSTVFAIQGRVCLVPAVLCAAVCLTISGQAQTDVLTWHNDSFRTGQNLSETILTPSNVNAASFGLLAKVMVDGKVDAEPLYASAVLIGSKRHNVVFIATEHDSVYAVDADSGTVLWQKSLLPTGETTSDTRNCDQVVPEIGITATPAIDRKVGPHGTMYVVAMSKDGAGNYFHRIHAMDLATGAEQFNGPVAVHAAYPGTGDGSSGGTVTFDPKQYKERPGLLILNGQLYTSWGSHCDIRPYGGWMMTYNETTLAQTSVLDFVPNGNDAAPWNAGAGPAADAAGNVYISLGNGTFDTTLNGQGFPINGDYGNALVEVKMNGSSLQPVDYWTMYNSNSESSVDTDLGSGGLMLLPDQVDANGVTRHLLVAAGKDHNLYVANRDNMGKYDASSNATLYEELPGVLYGGEWSSPAYFNSRVYYGSVGQPLESFEVGQAQVLPSPTQTTSTVFGYPGTTPSISANGNAHGIIWATENVNPAVLHAYDTGSLATEFYNSNQAAGYRDQFGTGNKFIAPMIANGKVYVGTTNSVGIFGFVRQTPASLADGDYTLLNNASGLVMDDPAASSMPGTNMYQWVPNGGLNQQWFFSYNGKGYYTIQNVSSGLFLVDANGSATQGVHLAQAAVTNDDTELWSLMKSGSGFVIQNKATGLVIDDAAATKSAGASIILWGPNGGANQNWTIQ